MAETLAFKNVSYKLKAHENFVQIWWLRFRSYFVMTFTEKEFKTEIRYKEIS